ncbi:hypothetical protein CFN78_24845 [Amycolatopsis antarctica]|uniref:Lipoprotein n=1 Tax=Amycolatopsis antarctica TaxID=1854586 RepID=A0A263CXG0_9PSEU|nr:LppA family lipoprotein [Amycolatopsis antarctica]OZM70628.1 hypothetical protein CFN78_24845 [Amycolatopsis antarctica]
MLVFAMSACGTEGKDINNDPNAGSAQEQYDKLLERPSFEDATEQYKELVAEVQRITVEVGGIPPKGTAVGGAACEFDFPGLGQDAGTRRINGGVPKAAIPDDAWPKVVAQVAEVGKRYGFERQQVFKDQPGNHQVRFFDSYGIDFSLSTEVDTSMSVSTACHFGDAARQRGAPADAG